MLVVHFVTGADRGCDEILAVVLLMVDACTNNEAVVGSDDVHLGDLRQIAVGSNISMRLLLG